MSQQKKKDEEGYILAEELAEIISCKSQFGSIKRPNLNQKDFGENLEAYFTEYGKHIEEKVREKHLEQYISFKKLEDIDRGAHFVKEFGIVLWIKYKVIISDLTIDNVEENTRIFLNPIYVDEYVTIPAKSELEQRNNGVLFEFRGNNFIGSRNKDITVAFGHGANFSFMRNSFEGPDLSVRAKNTGETLLEFYGNTFENGYVVIGVDGSKDYVLGNWRLKEVATSQIPVVNKLESLINKDIEQDAFKAVVHDHNKIKVAPEQIEKVASKSIIKISNNKCNLLGIYGDGNFHFIGENFIKLLTVENPLSPGSSFSPTIHWGAHQKLDEDGEYFLAHKKIFVALKQRAIDSNDTMQEIILQREIAKCDHAIAKSEKVSFPCKNLNVWENFKSCKNLETWKNFKACMNLETRENLKAWLSVWEDIIIFGFSKWISNYGTSWIRPFKLLFAFNVLIVVLVYITAELGDNSSVGAIFFELFNPTSYLPKMLNPKIPTPDPNAWISFLFISQKIILAFTLYEMIKIFRRFGRR